MHLPLQDSLKPYQNLKRFHTGLVVVVDDPTNRGRIKCKVEGVLECSDVARLPWCYPKQSSTAGGRADNANFATPPLYSVVQVEFPFDDIHYPLYTGMTRVDLTNPPIAQGDQTPEDTGLPGMLNSGTSRGYDLMGDVWVNTKDTQVQWVRVDKNKGSWEFFDQNADCVLRYTSGGNLQFKGASLTIETSEDVMFKVGGNLHFQVAGKTFLDGGGDAVINTGGNIAMSAAGNIDQAAGGAFGITSGGKTEINVGDQLNIQAGAHITEIAGGNLSLVAGADGSFDAKTDIGLRAGGEFGVNAGANFAVAAGAIASMTAGAIAALDAPLVLLNEGASAVPVNPVAPYPPSQLGTVAAGKSELATATSKLDARFAALDALCAYLLGLAQQTQSAGQSALQTIQAWANRLLGRTI